jgi:Right handed beta helix region
VPRVSLPRACLWLLCLAASACTYDAISFTQTIGGGDAGHDPSDAQSEDAGSEPDGEDAGAQGDGEDAGGDVTQDASVTKPDAIASLTIKPMYPWAPHLGQHVRSEDPAQSCAPTASDRSHDSCFDAGVWRVIELPSETSCQGITTESRYYASWLCQVVDGKVQLHAELGLDLFVWVDLEKGTWRKEQVTVERDGEVIARTEPQALWENPLHVLGAPASADPIELDEALSVYALSDAAEGSHLVITADQVTLLGGSQWNPIASLRTEDQRAFLRIVDMYVDPGGNASAVSLDVVHSYVENVSSTRSVSVPGSGADIAITCDASHVAYVSVTDPLAIGIALVAAACDVHALHVERAPSNCIDVQTGDTVVNVVVAQQCGGQGVAVDGMSRSTLRNVTVARAADSGVRVGGAQDSLLQELEVFDCGGNGVVVDDSTLGDPSRNTTVLNVGATNNGGHGLFMRGPNLRALKVLAASNDLDGLLVYGDHSVVMHVTAAQNGGAGATVAESTGLTLVNLVTVNNATGLTLADTVSALRARTVFATDNGADLVTGTAEYEFEGDVWLTSTPSSAVGAFAGRLPFGDEYNATWLDADGSVAYEDVVLDTFQFAFRHYGTDAAFPTATARGRCGPGERCAVWDWQVTKTGSLFNFVGAAPATYAADAAREVEHVWLASSETECAAIPSAVWESNQCRSHFLDCAYAQYVTYVNFDHFTVPPVDNGLCDAGETCWLAPNLGAYAGSGSAATVTKSAWLGTTLEKHEDNGR